MKMILVVDDHAAARDEMLKILEAAFADACTRCASTLSQARDCLKRGPVDLLVLDMGLPDGNGEDFIKEVLNQQPNCYIVMSTIHDESSRLLTALENGAKGYLLKEQSRTKLVRAFEGIMSGQPPLAPTVTRRILEHLRNHPSKDDSKREDMPRRPADGGMAISDSAERLTPREREILALVGKGFNRPEIAGVLDISKHTVATHLSTIYEKLAINNRSEATLAAQRLGLI